nr:unnamed protein product [Callosobruchus analis]
MMMYLPLLTLCAGMHIMSTAAEDQNPNYYDSKIQQSYEAVKDKDPKDVVQAIYPKIIIDAQQIGMNVYYFQYCVSKKYDKKDEANLEARTNIMLN